MWSDLSDEAKDMCRKYDIHNIISKVHPYEYDVFIIHCFYEYGI